MAARIPLEGQIFGDFKVIEYLGNKKYLVSCICCNNETKELFTNNIKNLVGVTCEQKKEPIVDLVGQKIGDWAVLKKIDSRRYLCRCSCENQTIREVLKVNLMNGTSRSCGHNVNHYGDLVGRTFGDWTVIGKEGYLYKVQCSCENKTISLASSYDLMNGRTRSCGHGYNQFYDITGQQFGLWKVIEYLGDQKYKCECQCNNKTVKEIRKADLLNGQSTSCGCNKGTKAKETLLMRYGEVGPNKIKNARTKEQLEAVSSREGLIKFIEAQEKELGHKLTSNYLANKLGLGLHRTLKILGNFGLEKYVLIGAGKSAAELELLSFIKSIYSGTIKTSDRTILNGKELDIYLPDMKVAFEYNGTYWHCDTLKGKYFHQNKSIEALKQGIRLIHVFEYEWKDSVKQKMIKDLIKNILCHNTENLYGRNTELAEISNSEAQEFLNKYHLQKHINAKINIGLKVNNELIGVMSLGKPRFDNYYEYEILRLCYKNNINIIGGTEKMFKYFTEKYHPKSIISYSNFAKFTGSVYRKLGFKCNNYTEPNYVWVEHNSNEVISRYQSQKHKLLEKGLGIYGNTEEEIMDNLGYLRVYDSGNLKFTWERKENT